MNVFIFKIYVMYWIYLMSFIYVIHLMCWNYLIDLITRNRNRKNKNNSRDWYYKRGARASRAPPFCGFSECCCFYFSCFCFV